MLMNIAPDTHAYIPPAITKWHVLLLMEIASYLSQPVHLRLMDKARRVQYIATARLYLHI